MVSEVYWVPKVSFEQRISFNSFLDQPLSILMNVKTLVGNVPQPILGQLFVGVSFSPSFSFSLLLTQNDCRKGLDFKLKCVFLCFHSDVTCETLFICLKLCSTKFCLYPHRETYCHNAISP